MACSLVTYIGPVYAVAMLTLLAIVGVTRQPMLGFQPAAYAWVLALGGVALAAGLGVLVAFVWGLRARRLAVLSGAESAKSGFPAYLLKLGIESRMDLSAGRSLLVDPEGHVLASGGSGEEYLNQVLDLERVPGVDKSVAKAVYDAFHEGN